MDEKSVLLPRRNGTHISTWRRSIGLFMLISLIIYSMPQVPLRSLLTFSHEHGHKPSLSEGTVYVNEKGLVWESCGEVAGRKLECSRLDVPMDNFDAANSAEKTFSLPLIRMRGDDDAKNILINPGGPGGSGHEFIYRAGERLAPIIGTGHHLVGFDPRGVNGSIPAASCFPNVKTRKKLWYTHSTRHPVQDSFNAYPWSQGFAQSCAESLGEHGKYINTPQTAADMNNILDALGQDKMIYWGFSYGTILGATYATMFPERSHRVMIDGVGSSTTWYDDVLFLRESFTSTDDVVFGFFDECIKAGADCPLSPFADSAEALQQKVFNFTFALEEPLSVYVNTSAWGFLRPEHIIENGIFMSLYRPSSWWTLADRLAQLLQGNATEAYLAWSGFAFPESELDGDDSNHVVLMNDAMSGKEYWPGGRQGVLDKVLPWMNSSIFAATWAANFFRQQQWIIPKTHTFKQKKTVETAHPLLILSATYDPVTPLINAVHARSIFQGSQVVERKGYGHCTLAVPSLCVARHVRAFLYNGTVPKDHVKCDEEGSYFKKPDSEGKTSQSRRFEDPEDEVIYQAQVELAKDSIWTRW